MEPGLQEFHTQTRLRINPPGSHASITLGKTLRSGYSPGGRVNKTNLPGSLSEPPPTLKAFFSSENQNIKGFPTSEGLD